MSKPISFVRKPHFSSVPHMPITVPHPSSLAIWMIRNFMYATFSSRLFFFTQRKISGPAWNLVCVEQGCWKGGVGRGVLNFLLPVPFCFFAITKYYAILLYNETCLKPHIKWTPSIKRTPAQVPKYSSHICCKNKRQSVNDTVLRWVWTPILSHFVAQNLQADTSRLFTVQLRVL